MTNDLDGEGDGTSGGEQKRKKKGFTGVSGCFRVFLLSGFLVFHMDGSLSLRLVLSFFFSDFSLSPRGGTCQGGWGICASVPVDVVLRAALGEG